VVNNIDTINIGSLGNAVNFGDLTIIASYAGAASNSKRVIFAGGGHPDGKLNVISHITINSAGDAVDFGDLSVARNEVSGSSNGHGGLALTS
jgi:hypothetical protein